MKYYPRDDTCLVARQTADAADMNELLSTILEFDSHEKANELFGPQNQNLALISGLCGVTMNSRGSSLSIAARNPEDLQNVSSLVAQLYTLLGQGRRLSHEDISSACQMFRKRPGLNLDQVMQKQPALLGLRRQLTARSLNQQAYLTALESSEMVFAIGPAGTGKTYLAVAAAVSAMLGKKIKRIVLTRPAVEAGEKLGYLPGDLADKVNPYLRPLYDALNDLLDPARVSEMIETGIIEVAPLAFMRGRTINNSYLILDEAQNTTPEQMKMFLTRLGANSRAVITGDITQIDLPVSPQAGSERSGLVQASHILKDVQGVSFIHFDDSDVVRHPLVARIVNAYERYQKNSQYRSEQ